MASMRVRDDGSAPARYWNKLAPARREGLWTQSRKEGKDIRQVVETFVYKPARMK